MLITDTTRPDAGVLAARLTGDAYGPADAGYDEHRIGFIVAVDLRPAIVALPESAADVRAIVDFAREHGLRVAPQATGHNAYPLGDLSDAILLKTSRMRGVADRRRAQGRPRRGRRLVDRRHRARVRARPRPARRLVARRRRRRLHARRRLELARAQARPRREPRRRARGRHRRRPPRARRPRQRARPVLGAARRRRQLRRRHGARAAAVRAARASTPATMFFAVERAAEVLKAWRDFTRTAPDEATSIGRILNVPPMPEIPEFLRGKSFVTVEMAYAGDEAAGAALIQPLRDLGPEIDTFATMPPVGLSKLHMDPEGQIPAALSDTLLLDAPRRRRDRPHRRGHRHRARDRPGHVRGPPHRRRRGPLAATTTASSTSCPAST